MKCLDPQISQKSVILKDFYVLPPLILDSWDPVFEGFTTSSSILGSLFTWALVWGTLFEYNPFNNGVLGVRIWGLLI